MPKRPSNIEALSEEEARARNNGINPDMPSHPIKEDMSGPGHCDPHPLRTSSPMPSIQFVDKLGYEYGM